MLADRLLRSFHFLILAISILITSHVYAATGCSEPQRALEVSIGKSSIDLSKPTIIIVDGYSSGSFLAPAFRAIGIQVIHIHSRGKVSSSYFEKSFVKEDYDLDVAYDGNLAGVVREFGRFRKIIGVVAGSDSGVILADKIGEILKQNFPDLPSDGVNLARKDKFLQNVALHKAGVDSALQFKTGNADEAIAWVQKNQLFRTEDAIVVVKPINSSGTEGVQFVRNYGELREALDGLVKKSDKYGQENSEVLVQEFLAGEEYVVNTTSRDGHHLVTDIWRYVKKLSPDGKSAIYDYDVLLPFEGSVQKILIEYNEKVLGALGVRTGNGHTEIKIVPGRGPVLVEFNNRMMGSGQPKIVELATGSSQVDRTALAYTNPEAFKALKSGYKLKAHAAVVTLANRFADRVLSLSAESYVRAIPGYQSHSFNFRPAQILPVTVDMNSSIGEVFVLRPSEKELRQSISWLKELETSGRLVSFAQ